MPASPAGRLTFMTRIQSLLFQAFNRAMMRCSNQVFRGILSTPPVDADPESQNVLYSLLDGRNVRAYLLALKSFLRFCPEIPFNVVVQDDGTLGSGWRDELCAHVRGIVIHDRQATFDFLMQTASPRLKELLPPGMGMAADRNDCSFFVPFKLLNAFYRFQERYVVVIDSDLLFVKKPRELFASMAPSKRQTIHSPGGNGLTPYFQAIGFSYPHVNINRFNCGFFGFFNDIPESALVEIVERIVKHDPKLFQHYEIEQALWAVLLNECGKALCLKDVDQEYCGTGWHSYDTLRNRAVFVHFVGATRFRNMMYPRLARQVMRQLRMGQRTS
jgi:hypothetical protein